MGTFRPPLHLIKLTTGVALFIGVAFSGDGNHQLYNWWWDIAMVVAAWSATQWIFDGVDATAQTTAHATDGEAKTPRPARAE